MYEFDGRIFKEGSIVTFDVGGRYAEIGVIIKIAPDDGNISATIIQPSGRRRVRTLDFDVPKMKIALVPESEAVNIDTSPWIKRYMDHYQGQG